MKKFFISFLVILLTLVFWSFTWNGLQELAYKGDGVFKSEGDLGPLLSNYSIDFPAVKLSNPNSYQYKFKRFPSNNTTWVSIKIDGLTETDTEELPEITVVVREDGEVVFERNGKLNFDERYNSRGKTWVGLKPLGQSSFDASWFSEYEIILRIHSVPQLEKDLELNLRLSSGWK